MEGNVAVPWWTCCLKGLMEVQVKMPTRGAVQTCLRLDALLSSAESATAADPHTPPPGGPGTYLAQDYRPYLRVALSQDWSMWE